LFEQKDIGGIVFTGTPTREELRHFSSLLFAHEANLSVSPGHKSIGIEIVRHNITHINVAPPMRLRLDGEERLHGVEVAPEVDSTMAYVKGVAILSQLGTESSAGEDKVGSAYLMRIVQELHDCGCESGDFLIGLTDWAKNDYDASRIAVDTCVIAMAISRSMDLPRSIVGDVGIASLRLYRSERGVDTRAEPMAVLRELDCKGLWSPSQLRRALAVAQQRQRTRGSDGLPPQHHLARICRVAADYVWYTHVGPSGDVAQPKPLESAEAIQIIVSAPLHTYDRLVVAHLVAAIGICPKGTLLQLADGREAFAYGMDDQGRILARVQMPNGESGPSMTLDNFALQVKGIKANVPIEKRASAMMGKKTVEMIQELGSNASNRRALGRIALRRIVLKEKRPEEEIEENVRRLGVRD
jgi:hypothetical protein